MYTRAHPANIELLRFPEPLSPAIDPQVALQVLSFAAHAMKCWDMLGCSVMNGDGNGNEISSPPYLHQLHRFIPHIATTFNPGRGCVSAAAVSLSGPAVPASHAHASHHAISYLAPP